MTETLPPDTRPILSTRVAILGVEMDAQAFADAIATLTAWASDGQARRVAFCPVYTIMCCYDDPALRGLINSADMVAADGMPVVWVQRRRGASHAERVYGPDVMMALCEATAQADVRHFLLGGAPGVGEALADVLRGRFAGLNICGTYAPEYEPHPSSRWRGGEGMPTDDGTDQPHPQPPLHERGGFADAAIDFEAIRRIRESGAQVVWVGLGSPKQDVWMAAHAPYLDCLLIGVGAAFDFLSGRKAQAPRWMQRNGLEWVFRLASEPRRLWQRYLVENPRFVWHVWREGRRL